MAIIKLPVEETPEYQKQLAHLRSRSPLRSDYSIVGWRHDGELVFFPGSYRAGFENSLRPLALRATMEWSLGLVGQLTDGRWVYPPSFADGQQRGDHLRNELRFEILAERARTDEEEKRKLQKRVEALEDRLAQRDKPVDSGGE